MKRWEKEEKISETPILDELYDREFTIKEMKRAYKSRQGNKGLEEFDSRKSLKGEETTI